MSIWWHLIYSSCDCSPLCGKLTLWLHLKAKRLLLCIFQVDFISLVGACKHKFVTSWFPFLPPFLLAVSPSWQQGKSGQGERRAWPRNCSQAPAPVQVGLLAGTLLSLSLVLQAKERDVEMHSCLLSNPPFFFFFLNRHHGLILYGWTLAWPVQKTHLQVFLIFDSASVWALIFLFVLKSPFIRFCCTFTLLLVSPSTLYTCLLCLHRTQCLNLHHYCAIESHRDFVLNNFVSWVECIKK